MLVGTEGTAAVGGVGVHQEAETTDFTMAFVSMPSNSCCKVAVVIARLRRNE